jgi:hypothetical protein
MLLYMGSLYTTYSYVRTCDKSSDKTVDSTNVGGQGRYDPKLVYKYGGK